MTLNLNQINFKIDPEFSTLIRKMSYQEYEGLKNSIKETEQHEDITIGPDRTIYDGHHRYKACTDLKIPVKYKVKEFKDRTEIIRFIIDNNDKRRHIQEYERGELIFKSNELEQEQNKAKQRQIELAGTRPNNNIDTLGQICPKVDNNINDANEKGRTIEILAKKHGFSRTQLKKIKKIMGKATEEQKKKLREGKTKVHKVWNKIHRDEKIQNLHNNAQKYKLHDKCQIYHADFREKLKTIQDNITDLIFVDPPYGREYLYLYKDLASIAASKLKPGGSLVCYINHYLIHEILDLMKHGDLEYWWMIGEFHVSQSHKKMRKQNVTVSWKPLLWFVKKGESPYNVREMKMFEDSIFSRPPKNKKLIHEWEQSLDDALFII